MGGGRQLAERRCVFLSVLRASVRPHLRPKPESRAPPGRVPRYPLETRAYGTSTSNPVAPGHSWLLARGCSCSYLACACTSTDGHPYAGEIDILEGVNDVSPNQATLHTSSGECTCIPALAPTSDTYDAARALASAGCTMPASRSQSG